MDSCSNKNLLQVLTLHSIQNWLMLHFKAEFREVKKKTLKVRLPRTAMLVKSVGRRISLEKIARHCTPGGVISTQVKAALVSFSQSHTPACFTPPMGLNHGCPHPMGGVNRVGGHGFTCVLMALLGVRCLGHFSMHIHSMRS